MIPGIEDGREDFRFVPVSASGGAVATGGPVHLVILLRRPEFRDPSEGAVSRLLHPADATVALMQETLDAERFGPTAIRLARLAASSHCYELSVGTPAATADRIEELFSLDPVTPLEVSVRPPSPAIGADVVSVVGRRPHRRPRPAVRPHLRPRCRRDPRLGAPRRVASRPVDRPRPGRAWRPFVAQLRALGVLTPAAGNGDRELAGETR